MTLLNRLSLLLLGVSGGAAAMLAASLSAQTAANTLSLKNSFRIGNEGVRCSAQITVEDPQIKGMFDRAYRLTCRDASGAVGHLISVRDAVALSEFTSRFVEDSRCEEIENDIIEPIGSVEKRTCEDPRNGVRYRSYRFNTGRETVIVEGLAGYDPALRIALASVVSDREVPGRIEVAQTEVSDAAAFARVQAGSLTVADARAEAYLRNNSGSFAEAGQFFESLANRTTEFPRTRAEAVANQALQESNLSRFSASTRLFAEAEAAIPEGDALTPRLLRNYRAMDWLNRADPNFAVKVLDTPMAEVSNDPMNISVEDGFLNVPLASQINRENLYLQRLGGVDLGLSPRERAEILDAQALALKGTALRQLGKLDEADNALIDADRKIANVRDGAVASARWMRLDISLERALISEERGDNARALETYDRALRNVARVYPQSPIWLATQTRKANFLMRIGQESEARDLFADVVRRSADIPDSSVSLRELLVPYFISLAEEGTAETTGLLFEATQLLQRPGVAQTQAVLARQMSEGTDDAAALFNLSLKRGREIARTEGRVARLLTVAEPTPAQTEALVSAQETLEYLRGEQVGLLSQLAEYPKFRSITPNTLPIAELQASLRDNEAYYKLFTVGGRVLGLWVTSEEATSFLIEGSVADLDYEVATIRDSIVLIEDGAIEVFPFEVSQSHLLYERLFGRVSDRLDSVEHLVFEPDGPMLQLPPQVLATSADEAERYDREVDEGERDPYDYTDITWLGKKVDISIAVSPRGFIDIRKIAPSKGGKAYLGLGTNALPGEQIEQRREASTTPCLWPLGNWRSPIGSDELFFANERIAKGNGDIFTEGDFSDRALKEIEDLSAYRVVHFATHGLVSAPAPDCPAEPALVTSFAGEESDGLLTFTEIFDLNLDADVVILSACDTAGMATIEATREAGVTGGGNYALDGLVRAFVGAGARTVVASHWPVPDDFNATQRLIEGMIGDGTNGGITQSLAETQVELMEEFDTSHPFYWGAFIVLGDGTRSINSEG